MVLIACPSCGSEGKAPEQLLGKKIKCQICGMSFLAAPALPSVAVPVGAASGNSNRGVSNDSSGSIEIEGLDASNWVAPPSSAAPSSGDVPAHVESVAFTPSPATHPGAEVATKQYKLLTQKDKWFEGKFDICRLEDALNRFARQGWVVRAMLTPHLKGFSGGPQEEIVVLLER